MFTISLIGPDGCGKTTLARRLEQSLPWPARYVYMGVSLESSNVMLPTSRLKLALRRLMGKPSDTSGPRDSTKQSPKPKGPLKRVLRFGKQSLGFVNQVAEELFRQGIVRWHLARGRIVILDRDFFADYYAYDIAGGASRSVFRRIHGWLLQSVYRKPDAVLFLHVSGETMFARKGEGSVELLNRRNEDYRQLQTVMPNFSVIDAEQSLADVIRDVQARVATIAGRHIKPRRMSASKTLAGDELPASIVIGQDCITGLQTARSLARHGIPVIGIAKNKKHFCCRTRVCQRVFESPTDGDDLITTLKAIGPALRQQAVLYPCTDLSVLTISKHRAQLEPWFRIALPSHDVIHQFTDKISFARFAESHDLPIPQTRMLRSGSDAHRAAEELTFPCYLKPAVKTNNWEANTKKKAYLVHNAQELIATYQLCCQWTDNLLVQEEIAGPSSSLFTSNIYFDKNGNVIGHFESRKMRQWPPQSGTGCSSFEITSEYVKTQCLAVFQNVHYHGLAYAELKRDERNGRMLFIETNVGRPTGRSAAAVASGVDLLFLMYCDLVGLPISSACRKENANRKWIHLRRDIQAALFQWRSGALSLVGWFRSVSGPKSYAVFSWRDPVPFLAEVTRYSNRAARELLQKIVRV